MKKKKIGIILLLLLVSVLTISCKQNEPALGEDPKVDGQAELIRVDQLKEPDADDLTATIVTNYGEIKIRLFPEVAEKTVENFTEHAKAGYYDGLIFHRVMEDFMIQGGDPLGTGSGGESIWGEPFEDEFHLDLRNYRGALSMANSGPNTNGSQFFIVEKSEIEEDLIGQMEDLGEEGGYTPKVIENYKELGGTPWLDFGHTVFGQVYEGMDVVDEIAKVEVDNMDKPLEDIIIKTISIDGK